MREDAREELPGHAQTGRALAPLLSGGHGRIVGGHGVTALRVSL